MVPSHYAACIGIDWADRAHAIALRAEGSSKIEHFLFTHTPERIEEWARTLRERFGGKKLSVSLEQSRRRLTAGST